MNRLTIILGLTLALAITLPVYGANPPAPARKDWTAALSLTAAQRTAVGAILDDMAAAARPHWEKAVALGQQITAAWKADKPDAAQLNSLLTAQGQEEVAARQALVPGKLALKDALTPAQFAKLPPDSALAAELMLRPQPQPGKPFHSSFPPPSCPCDGGLCTGGAE